MLTQIFICKLYLYNLKEEIYTWDGRGVKSCCFHREYLCIYMCSLHKFPVGVAKICEHCFGFTQACHEFIKVNIIFSCDSDIFSSIQCSSALISMALASAWINTKEKKWYALWFSVAYNSEEDQKWCHVNQSLWVMYCNVIFQ